MSFYPFYRCINLSICECVYNIPTYLPITYLSNHARVRLSIHLSIYPTTHPPIDPCIYLSISMSVCFPSVYLASYLSTYFLLCRSIYLSVYLFTFCLSIYLANSRSICFGHLSISIHRLSIQLFITLSVYQSSRLFTYSLWVRSATLVPFQKPEAQRGGSRVLTPGSTAVTVVGPPPGPT